MNINNDNYELWLLRYAEQVLTSEERKEVVAWLSDHPEAAEELSLYSEAPRLTQDESIKATAVPQHSISLWPTALRWAAAAAVVAVLLMPAMRKKEPHSVEPTQVAYLDSIENIDNPEPQDITDNQRPPAPSEAIMLAERLPPEAQQIPDVPDEETTPETEVPAPTEIVQPAYIMVDDLIVFEDEIPENTSASDILADAEVIYTQSTSNINPIGHFISIFIKANK